ncbi:MAG: class I SAM-dependent methyltransferase [Chloroflexota bacterium]
MDLEQYEVMFQQEEQHWWYRGMRQITGALLDRWYRGPRPAEILDAGCGTGGMVQWLRDYGNVTGVDLAEAALSRAHSRGITTLARGSVDALPFQSGCFDLVTSFDVLYHLDVKSDEQALTEIFRVLRPGGMLLIRVPAHDWLRGRHDVSVHTRHRYGHNELSQKLRRAGFKLRHVTYANSLLFPLAPIKRLLERTDQEGVPDLWRPPEPINTVLAAILGAEGWAAASVTIPVGLSIVAVARR